MINKPVLDYPFLTLGFRSFFPLAGLSALLFIALWNAMSHGSLHLDNYFQNSLWHAHEMLLGFLSAVIAGVLLTAVASITAKPAVTQDQMLLLCFVWLYGRVAPFYSELLPDAVIALIDMSFLPVLAFFSAKTLLQSGQQKALVYPAVLLVMAFGNGLIHAQILGLAENTAASGLLLAVAVIVALIVAISANAIPSLIERGLSGVFCMRNPLLDTAALVSSVLVFGLLLLQVSGAVLAVVAGLAAVIHCLRLAGWYNARVWYVPLLWLLLLGYGWLVLGFGLLVLDAFSVIPRAIALHAFTVGSMSLLSLGVMARLVLGQTGRIQKTSHVLVVAFILINVAALLRVILPVVMPAAYQQFICFSAYSWLAAFSLFAVYYFPAVVALGRTDK